MRKQYLAIAALAMLAVVTACSTPRASTLTAGQRVEHSLDQAGLKNVKVNEDQAHGVLTLRGSVKTSDQKNQAETIAKNDAQGLIVANEVSIEPVGQEAAARKIEHNLDEGIERDYRAAVIANHLDTQDIQFDAKNGVLTLSGAVNTVQQREAAMEIAGQTPNVSQVVNELQVRHRTGRKRRQVTAPKRN